MAVQDYAALAQTLYVTYFGRPGDYFGMQSFQKQLNDMKAPTDLATLSTLTQADKAGTTALSKLVNSFSASPEATDMYGTDTSALGVSKFVEAIYLHVLNRAPDAAGWAFWVEAIASGTLPRATAAAAIADGAAHNTSTQGLLDAKTVVNKIAVATDFTNSLVTVAQINGYAGNAAAATARDMLAVVDSTTIVTAYHATVVATVDAVVAGSIPSTTFTLTTGVDSIVGGSGNDIFNAASVGTAASLSALDSIDGGAGKDTLNITDTNAIVNVPSASIKNVETAVVTSASTITGLDTSGWTGLTSLTAAGIGAVSVTAATTTGVSINATAAVDVIGGGAALSVTTGAAAITVNNAAANAFTSATIVGGSTVDIVDHSGASAAVGSTLTKPSISGNTGAVNLTGKGITSVTYANTNQNLTITNATAAHTQSLTLNKVTGGTIKDTAATAINVTATGTKSSGVTLDLNNVAKTVAVDGTVAFSGALSNTGALTAVTSTNSVGTTITSSLGTAIAFTGGVGADSVIVGATTKAIAMGDGNDIVNVVGATLGTGGTIDGGAGIDTLLMAAADLDSTTGVTANSTFAGLVTGFEVISVGAMAANTAIDLANLNNANTITDAGGAFTLTLNNLASGASITQTANATGTTVNMVTNGVAATVATNDVLNYTLTGGAIVTGGTLSAAGVETVKYTSTDSNATPAGTLVHTSTLTDAAATTITVGGNAGLNLTHTGTALTSFNASGLTVASTTAGADAVGVTFATGVLANAATLTGSAGVDNIDASLATKAVTIIGGGGGSAGNAGDTLKGGLGADTITATGAGNATLVGNGGKDIITGAAGNDVIWGGAAGDTMTGGGGNNTFKYTLVSDSAPATYDTIVDFHANTATTAGDVIQLAAAMFGGVATTVNVSVASNGSLALAALGAASHAANLINIALDSSTGTLYIDGQGVAADFTPDGTADMAIILTGVTTLTSAAFTIV